LYLLLREANYLYLFVLQNIYWTFGVAMCHGCSKIYVSIASSCIKDYAYEA